MNERPAYFVKPAFAFVRSLWKNGIFELNLMLTPRLTAGPEKRGSGPFDATLGALVGATTGGVLGLFAIGIYPAIVTRDISYLIKFPSLSLVSCLICAPVGWLLGWLIGPRLGRHFNSPKVEIVAGAVAGLVPVIAIILWVALRS